MHLGGMKCQNSYQHGKQKQSPVPGFYSLCPNVWEGHGSNFLNEPLTTRYFDKDLVSGMPLGLKKKQTLRIVPYKLILSYYECLYPEGR